MSDKEGLRVTVTVEEFTGTNDRGYDNWTDLARVSVTANDSTGWGVYRHALEVLTTTDSADEAAAIRAARRVFEDAA